MNQVRSMRRRARALGLLSWLAAAAAAAQPSVTLIGVGTYGNFHAGGVVAAVSGDGDGDATASLEWRRSGEPGFRAGHPLVRIDAQAFAGSLFWLDPGTGYEVRVTLADPDGVVGSPTATAALTTRADTLAEPSLRTLYVSPTGSDGHSGLDPDYPLRTLQHAADLAGAGDLVSAAPGIYRESVELTSSGTAAQPIVFRGAGSGVILDGADETIYDGVSWTFEGSGVYSYATGFATGHVVTDLGRLYRYDSLGELQGLGAGAPGGFYRSGTRLYVKFANGSSPAVRQMHVARYEDGFYVDGLAHIRIENFEIRHFGSGDYGKGVYLRYSSDCAVRLCRIHEVESAGVWIKGGERHLVEHNELWDTSIFNWPWPYSKGSSAENNTVVLTNDVGRGNVVRRNTIYGTFNGIGPCGDSPPPTGITTETDVYENTFRQHTDDALEPEGHCANVRIWDNTIEDAHMAFAVAPAAPGPTYLLRNIAYNTGNTRTSQLDGYTASALKINSGYATPIGPLYLYHNTFLTEVADTSAVELLNPGASTFIKARNNLMAGTRYALAKYNPVTLDWDWDDLYTTNTERFVYWEGTRYDTLAGFRAGTGQETNGLAAAPKLVAPASGDFRPRADSALVDRGQVIPGINDDYDGSAPDVGACERADAIFADGFESGDTAAWSTSSH